MYPKCILFRFSNLKKGANGSTQHTRKKKVRETSDAAWDVAQSKKSSQELDNLLVLSKTTEFGCHANNLSRC